MTLVIENVKEKHLDAFKKLSKDTNATIAQEIDECPICKAQDYTLSPKAEKRILRAVKDIEKERKDGALKSYTSIDELRRALEA